MSVFFTRKAAVDAINAKTELNFNNFVNELSKKPLSEFSQLPEFTVVRKSSELALVGVYGYVLYVVKPRHMEDHIDSIRIERLRKVCSFDEFTDDYQYYTSHDIQLLDIEFHTILNVIDYSRVDFNEKLVQSSIEINVKGMRDAVQHDFILQLDQYTYKNDLVFDSRITEFKFKLSETNITNRTDSRFVEMVRPDTNVDWVETRNKTFEEIIELAEQHQTSSLAKLNNIIKKYEYYVEAFSGVELFVDGKKILCHRAFMPMVTGGFITFKCPYTGRMISLKSININKIEVSAFDRVNNLIGHNIVSGSGQ
jgi:hypothetical protein